MARKKSVNPRTKGSSFERNIAKILSAWSGIELRRTPLSGGWAKGNPEVAGDLVSVDPEQSFRYHVECKNSEAWSWEQILNSKKISGPIFKSWWKQAYDECPKGKIPVLVFSKAYHDIYIMFQVTGMEYTYDAYHASTWISVRHEDKEYLIRPLQMFLDENKYIEVYND